MQIMQIIFIDRDGVINHESEDYIKTPDEFKLIHGSAEAIANLSQAGFTVVVCTNQSGIGRKLLTVDTLNLIHDKLHEAVNSIGGAIDAIVFCPHHPLENCSCRKPKPGMIVDICKRFNVETKNTALIGDSLRDLHAISSVGGLPILVKTGNGKTTINETLPEKTLVFNDLLDASKAIIIQHYKEENEKTSE